MSDSCLSRSCKTHPMECMVVRATRPVSRCVGYDSDLYGRTTGWTHNPSVVGSNSTGPTQSRAKARLFCGPCVFAAVARTSYSRLPRQILQGPLSNFPNAFELRKSPGRGLIVILSGTVWLPIEPG